MAVTVGFTGELAKLRKAIISFVMFVGMEHLCPHRKNFHEI
jgi:hypothetical protein